MSAKDGEKKNQPLPKRITTWQVKGLFASVDSIPVDTAHLNFQNDNHIDKFSISNLYRGNLGSPIKSKVYFDQPEQNEFIFADAYYPYIAQIQTATFFNTTTPFSSLYYLSGGTNYHEDEQIKFLFTVNANKKLNFGTTLDYIYARGEYPKLSAKRFAGSLFGTFDGKKYKATAFLSSNNHNNFENGGIADTKYINGSIKYPPNNIPVNIDGFSNYRQNQLFYNHQYNIGIERVVRIDEDSVRMDYVPVTIFAHTLKVDDYQKKYFEPKVENKFYENSYLPFTTTNDTASLLVISNQLSVSMAEEFNKWLKFGLTAYIQNDFFRYGYLLDSTLHKKNYNNTRLGGVLSKSSGDLLRYNILGELTFLGRNAGDVRLEGDLSSYFNLWNQKINLEAQGFIRRNEPSEFLRFYNSNHFKWHNNFDKVYNTRLGGTFAIPTLDFKFNLSIENVTNFVYFDEKALPKQYSGNIQILAANLKQNFHIGSFTLENNAVYQLSSNQFVLPLPELTLYHNLYYHGLWFKVLSMQFGVDVRYHTAYYAQSYMPATGQFYVQDKIKIGNYPVMNVYVNAHLKRTRFFAQYYHVNQLFMTGDYYSMPYYPINPATFRMGLTWNFYD
ncbi:putative porin [Paludibacter sp.]